MNMRVFTNDDFKEYFKRLTVLFLMHVELSIPYVSLNTKYKHVSFKWEEIYKPVKQLYFDLD